MDPITAGVIIGGSIISGIFGSSAKKKAAKAQKKAARANYNLLMDNAGMLEDNALDQSEMFARQGEKFRATQMQKYGMSGVRLDEDAWKEQDQYKLGVDEIDYKGAENRYETKTVTDPFARRDDREAGTNTVSLITMKGRREVQVLKETGAEIDTKTLKQAEFEQGGGGSVTRNLQASTENLQKDLNKVYQQGMKQVFLERQKAEYALSSGNAQAAATNADANATLWAGLFSAANTYAGYKWG